MATNGPAQAGYRFQNSKPHRSTPVAHSYGGFVATVVAAQDHESPATAHREQTMLSFLIYRGRGRPPSALALLVPRQDAGGESEPPDGRTRPVLERGRLGSSRAPGVRPARCASGAG